MRRFSGLFASIERKPLGDGVADSFAQGVERGAQALGQRGIGCDQLIEFVAQALQAHGVEDAAGEDAALRGIADVGQGRGAGPAGDRCRDRIAILRQQHLRERA
ncbi:hypothetical protein BRDID11002_37330 [Bradyrhizobium diazoefficiens]